MTMIRYFLAVVVCLMFSQVLKAQDDVRTVFNGGASSGGYGAVSNKFTSFNGEFVNMVEVYGGWFIDHKFLIGGGVTGSTNYIEVPLSASAMPGERMSYQYCQVGLVTDYIIASNSVVHVGFHVTTGAGLTFQYYRPSSWNDYSDYEDHDYDYDENWFFVVEPGLQVEINLLKWMRFSPGVSYRITDGSEAKGLSDDDLRGLSVNATLKFGRF